MLAPHPDGVLISVWVVPNARRDEVVGPHGGDLRVRVTAPPEGGKANRAIAQVVAEAAGARRGDVITGHRARRKSVLLRDIDIASVRAALGIAEG